MKEPATPGAWSHPEWVILALAAATLWGFGLMPLLLRDKHADAFTNEHFQTWMVAIVLQATTWIAAVVYVVGARGLLLGSRAARWDGVIPTAVILALLFLPAVAIVELAEFAELAETKPEELMIFPINLLGGLIAMAFVVWGIIRIHGLAGRELRQPTGLTSVGEYLRYQKHLSGCLLFAGTILALAFFGTHAFAAAKKDLTETVTMSPTSVNLWALFSSGVLATLYISARGTLTSLGHRIRERLCPMQDEPSQGWREWHATRSALDSTLRLQVSPFAELSSLLGILAPLAASMVATFMQRP